MNLQKLFRAQAELDAYIEQQHPTQPGENRLEKKVLALLVELGECANEWRGFKFWSNDQEQRVKVVRICAFCDGTGYNEARCELGTCDVCEGFGEVGESNPLLEEYVDCLHFILSIGNDLEVTNQYGEEVGFSLGGRTKRENTQKFFMKVFDATTTLVNNLQYYAGYDELYQDLLSDFMTLGDTLGFTEEQIESAYWKKYEINKQRQANGY